MAKKFKPTEAEIRVHALTLAASHRREIFLSRKDGETDTCAEQVLSDARKYAVWIKNGDEPPVEPVEVPEP